MVPGGISGIGAAIANQFSAAGCRVLAAGLPFDKAIPELEKKVDVAPLNVSDPDSIRQLIAGLEPSRHPPGYDG